mgnify:CR=1 FL=1
MSAYKEMFSKCFIEWPADCRIVICGEQRALPSIHIEPKGSPSRQRTISRCMDAKRRERNGT